MGRGHGLYSSGSEQGQVAGSCDAVMNFRVPKNAENLLASCAPTIFSMTLLNEFNNNNNNNSSSSSSS